MDQSLFAAPHSLSQRITSFIACACQGIHQLPLRHLIVLIANAHHLLDLECLSSSLALRGVPNLTIRTSRICQTQRPGYLLQPGRHDAIDVFDMSFIAGTPVHREVISLRPASRDLSGSARSGNAHRHAVRGSSNTKTLKARKPRSSNGSITNNKHALSNRLPTAQPTPHPSPVG